MEPRYAKLVLSTPCEECGDSVPIVGPSRAVLCSSCETSNSLSEEMWQELLERIEDDLPTLQWDRGRIGSEAFGGRELEYLFGRKWPRCVECEEKLEVRDIETGESSEVACGGCGRVHDTSPSPPWLKEIVPTSAQCFTSEPVGEDDHTETKSPWYLRFEGLSRKLVELGEESERERQRREKIARTTCPRCGKRPWSRSGGCQECGYGRPLLSRRQLVLLALTVIVAVGGFTAVRFSWPHLQRRWEERRQRQSGIRGVGDPSLRTFELVWDGRVTAVEAADIAVGTACALRYKFKVRGESEVIWHEHYFVCGGIEVYASLLMPRSEWATCRLSQGIGIDDDTYELDVACRSGPPRGDIPSLSMDTRRRRVLVQRVDPPSTIELSIDRDDGIWRGEMPLRQWQSFEDRVITRARVVEVSGEPPVGPGANCRVHVVPSHHSDYPCRVRVVCGGHVLYGGFTQGFAQCDMQENRPVRSHEGNPTEVDGDSILDLDLVQGTASVSDTRPDYSVRLALEQ